MKLPMKRILAAVLLLLLLPALPACRESGDADRLLRMGEEERAHALYEMVMEKVATAESYVIGTEMNYSTVLGGYAYKASVTSRDLCTALNGDDLTELSESVIRTEYDGKVMRDETVTRGYAHGYAFTAHEYDGIRTAQRTKLAPAEYRDFYGNRACGILTAPQYGACTTAVCTQTVDGGWEARFSGFDPSSLQALDDLYRPDFSLQDAYLLLSTAEVTVTVSEDFTVGMIRVDLNYRKQTDQGTQPIPTVSYTLRFSEWNRAEAEEIDLTDYPDVGDLSILDTFTAALEKRETADSGHYNRSLNQTVTRNGKAADRIFDRQIIFDTVEGDFTMTVNADVKEYGGDVYEMRTVYADGCMTEYRVGPEDDRTETPMTDAEARGNLAYKIEISHFYADDVTRIEIPDEAAGKYRFHLGDRTRTLYAESYAAGGHEMTVFESYVDVILRDGVLYSYVDYLHTGGVMATGEQQDNHAEIVCSFDAEN